MTDAAPSVGRTAVLGLRVLVCALAAALAWAALRLSWLSDDAFILFRAAENLVQGHGPVWNVGERVQTFTQPLWFFTMASLRTLTGEHVVTAQVAGLALSAFAVVLLSGLTAGAAGVVTLLALLLGSRAWTSFATSGMETAMNYVLGALLLLAWRAADAERRVRRVAILCGLFGLSRFDLLALAGPPLLVCALVVPRRTARRAITIGLAPLAAWVVFAAVYYGSVFPITAYAKALAHGVPQGELLAQGLRYWQRSVLGDPVTPAVIVAGIVVGLLRPGQRGLALGALGYSLYTLKVGGDYMLGRFLVPPFVMSLGVLLSLPVLARPRVALGVLVAALALTLLPGVPEAATPVPTVEEPETIPPDGIVDEQLPRHANYGLLARQPVFAAPGVVGAMLRAQGIDRAITVHGVVGWVGYAAGEPVHIVDPWLLDPLIARLPVGDPAFWRIGHFFRNVPAGYLESVASGENRIPHAGLARYWDAIRSAAYDPIWSAARWRHLVALWTGALDAGLADYVANEYRTPPRHEVPLARLSAPVPAPGYWQHSDGFTAQAGGLAIELPEPSQAAAVVLHVSGGASWDVVFRRDGREVGRATMRPEIVPPDLLVPQRVDVPATARPFDTIWIDALVRTNWPAAAFVGRVELAP